ncbi:MAG: sodium:solute symporter, partial [Alphaproteobacteria bacterium]|nr:sodium:solute symporter [Alphaproteobacteria bacterium]
FLLAFLSDRAAKRGTGWAIGSPVVYTLSLAVYCTSWTFYGAVGSATRNGLEFLTIYLGPTIVLMGWWVLLRKLVRISKEQRITSIADFVSARYGKSAAISAVVTLIAVIGITPYIALQLKAVSASFEALTGAGGAPGGAAEAPALADTGLWVALSMALFVILFGTRNLGADERHPGIVAAIAFESIVKLLSFAAIGLVILYGLHDGVADLFARAAAHPEAAQLFQFQDGYEARWLTTLFLAAAAMVCLPRQFQVAVVENADERHLATASWLFPLYLLIVSVFVVPIAIGGMLLLPADANPDLYVLSVPLAAGREDLALLAFIGGLSAGTSMVIVASIALSIMISNHWVTPLLLRLPLFTDFRRGEFSETLLTVRRLSIVVVLSLGYAYHRLTASSDPLASIGLISFAAAAQVLPALVGGVFWARATRSGALAGLVCGFAVWTYTLLVPNFAAEGSSLGALVAAGPWGIDWLRPHALFGLEGWDPLVHGTVWSITANVVAYVGVSVATEASPLESLQSALFVNALRPGDSQVAGALQRSATTRDLKRLTQRVLGPERAHRIFADYEGRLGRPIDAREPDAGLIAHVERQLASSVGAASARTLVSRIAKGETVSLDAVIAILDETQQAIRASKELKRKSRELEQAAEQLRRANAQLTRLDKMKDDFLSRVSHELRTPMTSIRSFAEILVDDTDRIAPAERQRFLGIIRQESERLTRLLDEILDLSRLESGQIDWIARPLDATAVVREAVDAMSGLAGRNGVTIDTDLGDRPVPVMADADRLKQVFVNLISNAIKYNDRAVPRLRIALAPAADGRVEVRVADNGPGVPHSMRESVFSKFSRGWNEGSRRSEGAGLGLPISQQIMRHMGGDLVLAENSDSGAVFAVVLSPAELPAAVAE